MLIKCIVPNSAEFRPNWTPAYQRPVKGYADPMTIAAGFICKEGVLLCADTEQTDWAMKLHGAKVGHFEFPGGKMAYAMSGASKFALSAIQKCRRLLESGIAGDAYEELETLWDAEYRRNVFQHPDYASDKGAIAYNCLIALWLNGGPTTLYETTENVITRIDNYQCIGFGDYLAHYLLRPSFVARTPQRRVLPLCAYSLSNVKDYVPNCGGILIYVMLRNDGTIGVLTSHNYGVCKNVEAYAKAFDFGHQELLQAMASEDSTDEQFEEYLRKFWIDRLLHTRKKWTAERREREEAFANVNPHLTADQAKLAFRELSMGFLPDLSSPPRSEAV